MTDPSAQQTPVAATTYPCGGCGARLEFAPGSTGMQCPYCGFRQEISTAGRQIREIAFVDLQTLPRKPVGSIGAYVFVCQRCAAKTETNETASVCQFCGAPLVIDAAASGQIVPEGVLPFALDRGAVRAAVRTWTSSRWFAPSALKKVTDTESMKSTYLPHWTFDSQTVSDYDGQRGEYYYVAETYTDSDGKQQTRQVRRTRWYPTDGTVTRAFDDVLVPASAVLPVKTLDDLAPWPLEEAMPYQPEFLAGHFALRYDVEPENGFTEAKNRMAPVITEDCRHDIGGDEQQVRAVDTRHHDVTFKLLLLPVWIASYVYAGRTWQILVNGQTAQVHGERPWSKVKITIAVILVAILLAVVAYFVFGHGGGSGHHSDPSTRRRS
jgi:hypothetical protein